MTFNVFKDKGQGHAACTLIPMPFNIYWSHFDMQTYYM